MTADGFRRTVLPAAAGVLAALGIGYLGGVAPVIMVCGAIYLFAAAIGRRWAAWAGFAVSFVVLAPSVILDDPWITLAVLGALQVVLVIVGAVRGVWRAPLGRLQLVGALVFSVLAIAAAAGVAPWAVIAAITGLLAHGAWDIWHHHRDAVVPRPYASFCAALDLVLAGVVLITLIWAH
jgi:hypothetical protein